MRGKLNVLISGGTGTGKTTTLNALSAFVPGDERIVTIEDAAELQLQQEHVITLESRPPNIEGQGEVRIRELVRNALRMRPDRIIVGEVRGAETLDMLQAMNTGHEGSLTTIHANSPRDALSRLETLVLTAGVDLPLRAIREQISSAFDLLVQITRLVDGSRRITHITEVLRMESDVITLQDIFVAKPPDEEPPSDARRCGCWGRSTCTGLKPHFLEKMAANGVVLPPTFFEREDERAPAGSFAAAYASAEAEPPDDPAAARASSPAAAALCARRAGRRAASQVRGVDASGYPNVRLTRRHAPSPSEAPRRRSRTASRRPACRRENLGRAKSVVLAIDRSRSMKGAAASRMRSPRRGRSSPRSARRPRRRRDVRARSRCC